MTRLKAAKKSFRAQMSLDMKREDSERLKFIANAYMFLEQLFLFQNRPGFGSQFPLLPESVEFLTKNFASVDESLPWEARKSLIVQKFNRLFESNGFALISGRLFQNIPQYLTRLSRSEVDLNARHGPVWGTHIRFFSHNSRVESTHSSSLDPEDTSLELRLSSPELGSWFAAATVEVGSASDLLNEDLTACLSNVKFSRRSSLHWTASLTFSV